MMLGISWVQWITIGANFGASFVNTWLAVRLRQRIKQWDKTRAAWDASCAQLTERGEQFGKLTGFALMIAHAPDGALPAGLRERAREVLPPDVEVTVAAMPWDGKVH